MAKAANENKARWIADITWKDAKGLEMGGIGTSVEEVEELQGIIEHGPEWFDGMTVEITLTYAL